MAFSEELRDVGLRVSEFGFGFVVAVCRRVGFIFISPWFIFIECSVSGFGFGRSSGVR